MLSTTMDRVKCPKEGGVGHYLRPVQTVMIVDDS